MLTFGGELAAQIIVPSPTDLMKKARTKSYPRSVDVSALKSGRDWDGRWISVQTKVNWFATQTLPMEPLAAQGAQFVTNGEGDKILLAAALWLRTGDPNAAAEAKRRALNLASWSTSGNTGFLSNDQAGRGVARALALAYDWMSEKWTPEEQAKLLSAIRPRLIDILSNTRYGLNNGLKLDAWPYDSHGQSTSGYAAVICTVLAGRDLIYDQCLIDILPRYLSRPSPWGGNDGGYANGTAYANWDLLWGGFFHWGLLKQVVGVDMWQTPWALNYGKFITYFLPPGTPSGLFGDEANVVYRANWATQAKVYSGHLPSPLADWYAHNQTGEDQSHFSMLLSPQHDTSSTSSALPVGTEHGIHIKSIGWTAMHSNLNDNLRTSVYFKSSWYGSYNHSHADQNSFVIHANGVILADDSGYYDAYNSPHWKNWYKQTRAHNAITFDGGYGQMHDTINAKGVITQFTHTSNYDLATGDARAAYGGLLTRAIRSIVYLRPNTLLVFDSLASNTARTWEWNIHAKKQMIQKDANKIEIIEGITRLCVRMVVGPEVVFNQKDQFTSDPVGIYPKQWHGTFSSTIKSKEAFFVTVLEVGCENSAVTVAGNTTKRDVTVLGNTFSFDGVSVTKK